MRAFITIAILIVSINAKIAWPCTTCGSPTNTIQITQCFLSAKPTKSSTNEITLLGESGDHVELSEVRLTAKLYGIPVQVYHLEDAAVYDAGDVVNYVYPNVIPGFTPSGKYDVEFEFVDTTEKTVGCVSVGFTL